MAAGASGAAWATIHSPPPMGLQAATAGAGGDYLGWQGRVKRGARAVPFPNPRPAWQNPQPSSYLGSAIWRSPQQSGCRPSEGKPDKGPFCRKTLYYNAAALDVEVSSRCKTVQLCLLQPQLLLQSLEARSKRNRIQGSVASRALQFHKRTIHATSRDCNLSLFPPPAPRAADLSVHDGVRGSPAHAGHLKIFQPAPHAALPPRLG
jgi:hypothetical protein